MSIPKITKKIQDFFVGEEGSISKDKVIKTGIIIGTIAISAGVVKAEGDGVCNGGSGNSKVYYSSPGHKNNCGPHNVCTSDNCLNTGAMNSGVRNYEVCEDYTCSNITKDPATNKVITKFGHSSHGSHASHMSHGSNSW